MIDKTLGHYQIEAKLGQGGMGDVYKARDTRLDRPVAIKLLSSQAVPTADLRERFKREARAVASLSHPHICTLYDVGREEDKDFLVMEYLEGESLAARLQKGPLPLDQVLRYGAEIAEALSAAHRIGILHRDLKPGNVMLTKTGAKLLDFGLAKLVEGRKTQPAGAPEAGSALATEEHPLTGAGMVLGTFQYMAPEQLEGKVVDARSDI